MVFLLLIILIHHLISSLSSVFKKVLQVLYCIIENTCFFLFLLFLNLLLAYFCLQWPSSPFFFLRSVFIFIICFILRSGLIFAMIQIQLIVLDFIPTLSEACLFSL